MTSNDTTNQSTAVTETAITQWVCSVECWQDGGPHTADCFIIDNADTLRADRMTRALAAMDTIVHMVGRTAARETCRFCPASEIAMPLRPQPDLVHDDDCVWVEARRWVEDNNPETTP